MKLLLILSLFLNFNSEIRIVNSSKNDQEIKVFRNDILVHHHIMKDGDWLTIYEYGSQLTIRCKKLTNNCVESEYKFKNPVRTTQIGPSDWNEVELKLFPSDFPKDGIRAQYTIPPLKCPCRSEERA